MNAEYSSAVAMVRPAAFQYNPSTADSNRFQNKLLLSNEEALSRALLEFDRMVNKLREWGIDVLVLHDEPYPVLPDAVFPNNWFISLPGEIILCPMQSVLRRGERKAGFLKELTAYTGAGQITNWTAMEAENEFLEGTGSLVLDRKNKIAFACRSERTGEKLFEKFCSHTGYEGFIFEAVDREGQLIYHTNVMMCLGNGFAVVCEEAVWKEEERKKLREIISGTGREMISINFAQMENFAGNMLQLKNKSGEYILAMSSNAFNSLQQQQINTIENLTKILSFDVPHIERIGGGSVRCMMAELQRPVTK